MTYRIPITQSDLQAYSDGQLSQEREREVAAYIKENPEAAALVQDYRAISESIHAFYDPVLQESLPAHLKLQSAGSRFRQWRVAAAALWMALGGLIGWQLHPAMVTIGSAEMLTTQLVAPAAFAHVIYTPEVRHPVEVGGDQQEHMAKWLSKRLNTTIKVPDLTAQGYELVGGRLLPSTDRMAAQFMYQRGDGLRVTLYSRHGAWDNKHTSFQYASMDNTSVFYWIDGPLGFALVGDLSKQELFKLSESIYQQLN